VEKPIPFHDTGYLLFHKMCSNLSFKVGDEVVYVIHGVLTARSDYFRAMLLGSFRESQVPVTIDAEIPIGGIDVDLFKIIIEWIYSKDVRQLNVMFPSLLSDLERVYIAADMFLITDLCDSIVKYLEFLISHRTFKEIYMLSKRINSATLERAIYRFWISNSDEFNTNVENIDAVLFNEQCENDSTTSSNNIDPETFISEKVLDEEGNQDLAEEEGLRGEFEEDQKSIEDEIEGDSNYKTGWEDLEEALVGYVSGEDSDYIDDGPVYIYHEDSDYIDDGPGHISDGDSDYLDEGVEYGQLMGVSLRIIQASDWEGETENETCVIKCLASLLSVEGGA
jgi:hypothetical protein